MLRIAGQYHVKTEPPFIPGGEAAGEILQLGADVKGLKVGDRVLCGGGFAEETVQAAGSVIKLPDTVGFEAAAAFRSNYTTAYYALQRGTTATRARRCWCTVRPAASGSRPSTWAS